MFLLTLSFDIPGYSHIEREKKTKTKVYLCGLKNKWKLNFLQKEKL